MTTHTFNLELIHPSWRSSIQESLKMVDSTYLDTLTHSSEWLPGHGKIFNAFSVPIDKVKYVLFGESPYPRKESANGYAFWDAAVNEIWSPTGLSKAVNRATSLRNLIKMLLVAEGLLSEQDTSQVAISKIDKKSLVQTNNELFGNFLSKGFLLLNATPVLQTHSPKIDAREWRNFTHTLLDNLLKTHPDVKILLLGNIANLIDKSISDFPKSQKFYAEHPYNYTFIKNKQVQEFFKPLHLLLKTRGNLSKSTP